MNTGTLDRNQVKYIAAAAMLIDHIGMFFIPIATPLGMMCRIIGRITAPVMTYFVTEGYHYTSSKRKYGLRLFIFALISHFPYAYSHGVGYFSPELNMIFTLFVCFLVLLSEDKIKNLFLRYAAIVALLFLCRDFDWGPWSPIWAWFFYRFKDSKNKQVISFSAVCAVYIALGIIRNTVNGVHWYGSLWQAGLFLFIPFAYLYNGEKGKGGQFSKWFFYVFYPLHILILGIIYRS